MVHAAARREVILVPLTTGIELAPARPPLFPQSHPKHTARELMSGHFHYSRLTPPTAQPAC